ncbi:MAG: aminotransferase class IV [Anaerolineae bacterium]|nr:aminotransferase class IV [Anaerolineae bacterium]
MPTYIRKLTPDGLHPVDYVADNLADATRYEAQQGVYTVTNTYHHTQVLKLDAHLDRMEQSAHLAGIALTLDRARLRQTLRQMILDSGFGDVRFRITVGVDAPDEFVITLEPFTPPPATIIENGVVCMTIPNSARQNPLVKSTEWMHQRDEIKQSDAYETLLLDTHQHILEGTGSNFYAIRMNTLYTAGEGVLGGIARLIVLDVAQNIIPVELTPISVDEFPHIQEAFITSSSRGIIPVVKIDNHTIGDGRVGKITTDLREAYQAWVNGHLEEL